MPEAHHRPKTGDVVGQGGVPFAILEAGGGIVMARFRTTLEPQGAGWDDDEETDWTFTLDGHEFEVIPGDGKTNSLPIDEQWNDPDSDCEPLRAHIVGEHHMVKYHYYRANTYGSVSGDVTLAFDLDAMTVAVSADLAYDFD
ncbi:hypothetical protein ACSDR0_45435 [Streptosporangium sp. G11]|uniref:hypothetical protein n=1 Tax=Streptosporangium sp. G11 TaxID=3436926 RepID=UPI003EB819E7